MFSLYEYFFTRKGSTFNNFIEHKESHYAETVNSYDQ